MQNNNLSGFSPAPSNSTQNPASKLQANNATEDQPRMLPPGQWAREVLGFEAPFGHDRMPTVFG